MSKDRYVWLDGVKVQVSEEVYRAYYRPEWREAKQKDVRGDNEYSLDALEEAGFEAVSPDALIDEIVADKLLLDELYAALAELTDDERFLIDQFFYKEKSEREISKETNTPRNTLVYRKNRLLAKLKKLIEKI